MPWLDVLGTCVIALAHIYVATLALRLPATTATQVAPPRVMTVNLTPSGPMPLQPRRPAEPFSVPIVDPQTPPPLAMAPVPTRPDPPPKPVKSKTKAMPKPRVPPPRIAARAPASPIAPPAPATPARAVVAPRATPAPPPAAMTPPSFSAAYLDNPAPSYPAASRRNRESGVVRLRVQVSSEGRAIDVHIETSSGHHRLDEAALRAVKKWRFVPARRGEQPVIAWVIVPIAFRLQS